MQYGERFNTLSHLLAALCALPGAIFSIADLFDNGLVDNHSAQALNGTSTG